MDKHEYNLFVKQQDQATGLEKEAPVLPDFLVGMISSGEEKMEKCCNGNLKNVSSHKGGL